MESVNEELIFLNDEIFKDAEIVFHCGDMVKTNILDAFYNKKVYGVSGNMDGREVRSEFPFTQETTIENIKIRMLHGNGYMGDFYDKLVNEYPDTDLFLHGHTHVPKLTKKGKYYFFNPGSFSFNRVDKPARSAGLIDIDKSGKISFYLAVLDNIRNKKFKIIEGLNG